MSTPCSSDLVMVAVSTSYVLAGSTSGVAMCRGTARNAATTRGLRAAPASISLCTMLSRSCRSGAASRSMPVVNSGSVVHAGSPPRWVVPSLVERIWGTGAELPGLDVRTQRQPRAGVGSTARRSARYIRPAGRWSIRSQPCSGWPQWGATSSGRATRCSSSARHQTQLAPRRGAVVADTPCPLSVSGDLLYEHQAATVLVFVLGAPSSGARPGHAVVDTDTQDAIVHVESQQDVPATAVHDGVSDQLRNNECCVVGDAGQTAGGETFAGHEPHGVDAGLVHGRGRSPGECLVMGKRSSTRPPGRVAVGRCGIGPITAPSRPVRPRLPGRPSRLAKRAGPSDAAGPARVGAADKSGQRCDRSVREVAAALTICGSSCGPRLSPSANGKRAPSLPCKATASSAVRTSGMVAGFAAPSCRSRRTAKRPASVCATSASRARWRWRLAGGRRRASFRLGVTCRHDP